MSFRRDAEVGRKHRGAPEFCEFQIQRGEFSEVAEVTLWRWYGAGLGEVSVNGTTRWLGRVCLAISGLGVQACFVKTIIVDITAQMPIGEDNIDQIGCCSKRLLLYL